MLLVSLKVAALWRKVRLFRIVRFCESSWLAPQPLSFWFWISLERFFQAERVREGRGIRS
jgi:hypothetical protein